ncbi:hypothetical protein Achl_3964 (plasmid) [Pseudarthrobacter chlorophenolicus A6]|uniref:Uncharacterized protein n=1 Tax=Pseudarthrobacter chlorophenolicus (strain ATCC 700700 / DSM 12829 / CIP 107037 / JCM 12360 / KCTC 9906 / NCIMB 13794 / A6) TaxID=452863 RepID=B8HHL8_PSECP|nr:hypothetical protein [Pseudarthrobacter chlorophenolicus]ACL41915.1 hypothetical protein Achl_3964 [Pseudarthrobacter chlorophenolicus A6]SDQ18605.1 hypothetical protein SAMN04489738_0575 [Pseudarthrobacter chlorophenolicus]
MSPVTRVPGGIPAGGQFAPTAHSEPSISLGATFSESTIRSITNRHQDDEGVATIDLTEVQLAAVRDHIDRTGDFSYAGVRKAAEEAYFADNGYTPAEFSDYIQRNGDVSNYFADPNALRRDIEQARKDKYRPAYAD